MLARAKPGEAYRQSNFDVRLMASDRDDLVLICLDDLIENLGVLEIVEQRDDRAARSRTLTRCVTALTALEMGIDREMQRTDGTWVGYTGIKTIPDQDRGITESQGAIQDRSIEHLAGSDAMIIQVRNLLVNAATTLRDHGTAPPGVDEPGLYRQRSGSIVLPRDADVWDATKELREAFGETAKAQAPR